MNIINNKEEFENLYEKECYSKNYLKEKDYPLRYPCIVVSKGNCGDGGLMGEFLWLEKHYCPKKYDFESFAFGFEMGERA
jgi:hypothetical protein